MQKTFIDLVNDHHQQNNGANIYIKNILDNNTEMDCFEICAILPGSKLIATNDDFDVVQYGLECEASSTRLYLYKDYYIIYSFEGYGDDLAVLDIHKHYGDADNFINECIKVYHKDQFKYEYFLDSGVNNVNDLVNFFHNVEHNDVDGQKRGLDGFLEYARQLYLSEANRNIQPTQYVDPITYSIMRCGVTCREVNAIQL